MIYACPLCSQPLTLDSRTFKCSNNHMFDKAKEGYVNLMPAHHKHSKNPGDSKEMMQSRRAFLESGHYQKLQQQLANTVQQSIANSIGNPLENSQQPTILDIGCGEGYYTNEIANVLGESAQVYGLDIAKVAVRYASKRYANCHFSVASSYKLPFNDHSLDAIVKVYAPSKQEELLRCLKPGGVLVTVTPGARHLYQLRERIYQEVRLHEEQADEFAGLELIEQAKLNYSMQLVEGQAFELLQMTPFAWKASTELQAELKQCASFDCEADFNIQTYRVI
ncbi:23S rRNA (guanine(745)-N(1))-methyltransferase [Vibrio sp. B1Z05]|uniref:23S rRNA (guanine(745)-N(1))-methyltransferase n=1 Tax=Vibrio sp. B1Z05 TaxID=2654980 RepID=UPI00128C4B7A|nr:23S rRNA (guanine(745)-N(1))-methyltransferase [Vibrio sp. B1Z05]MPW35438.1 23S rRNA (guanine(745)-N(1))-methyltransferase [Vibrio sp. B1Z05]